jgi:hypothetical protein
MEFNIAGPFQLTRKSNKLPDLSKEARRCFWKSVEDFCEGLPNACGCYLFASRAGKGCRPWYVGKAETQSFYHEVFAPHKKFIFQDAMANNKGTPVIFLVPLSTPGGRYARPRTTRHGLVDFLESLLIGAALKKNRTLLNVQKTKYLRDIIVPGLLNSPKRKHTTAERAFMKAIRA